MKKIYLIFVGAFVDSQEIIKLKSQVINYLGERMITDVWEGYPGLCIKFGLDTEDRKYISSLVDNIKSEITILVLSEDSENLNNSNIIDVELTKKS